MPTQRLNWSTLRYIATSPMLMRYRAENPRPETVALRLGRAIHCAILEPGAFNGRWVIPGQCAAVTKSGERCKSGGSIMSVGEWFCRVKGHAPEDISPMPEGVEILSAEEADLVHRCTDAVMGHSEAAMILRDGQAECELAWEDPETGVACRGRLDWLKSLFLSDVKTTRQETVRGFVIDAARNMYHGQLAWYHDGAIAAGRLPQEADLPKIITVQTVEPYDVAVYRLSIHSYQAGQILKRDLLQRYLDCQTADWWPGIAPDVLELDLPNWAPGMNGSEDGGEW